MLILSNSGLGFLWKATLALSTIWMGHRPHNEKDLFDSLTFTCELLDAHNGPSHQELNTRRMSSAYKILEDKQWSKASRCNMLMQCCLKWLCAQEVS